MRECNLAFSVSGSHLTQYACSLVSPAVDSVMPNQITAIDDVPKCYT